MKTIAAYNQQLLEAAILKSETERWYFFSQGDTSNFNIKRLKEPRFLLLMFATSVLFKLNLVLWWHPKVYFQLGVSFCVRNFCNATVCEIHTSVVIYAVVLLTKNFKAIFLLGGTTSGRNARWIQCR